jgi:hypothetical protein
MINTYSKYKGKIALLVLFGYLLISVLTLFHYHQYNFNLHNALNEASTSNLNLQYLNHSSLKCIVYQNFNFLQLVNLLLHIHSKIDVTHVKDSLIIESFRIVASHVFTTIKLRAPPFSS